MSILKQKILEEISNNSLLKNILICEIDNGNNNSGDNIPDPDIPDKPESEEPNPDIPNTDNIVFDDTDPNLKYFTYQIDEKQKSVEVTDINYNLWETDNGQEVVIPATLGNYKTILVA